MLSLFVVLHGLTSTKPHRRQQRAIRLEPNYAAGYAYRGLAYERKGEKEKALADFQAAVALTHQRSHSGKLAQEIARERLSALTDK
jgi:Tfp pilus assembly protein PilF